MDKKLGDTSGLLLGCSRYMSLMVGLHLVKPFDRVGVNIVVNNGVMCRTQKNKIAVDVPFFWCLGGIVAWAVWPHGSNVTNLTYQRVALGDGRSTFWKSAEIP